jgi:hypothetical protein
MLSGKIHELEAATLSGTSAEKDAARNRKKQLREVLKYVSDKSNSPEDRLMYLQSRFSQQVTELVSNRISRCETSMLAMDPLVVAGQHHTGHAQWHAQLCNSAHPAAVNGKPP